jgi:hypothetical protein
MATRLYLCAGVTIPDAPGFAGWQETDGALRRLMRRGLDPDDALANGSAQASTAGNTQLHRQFVTEPMIAGLSFTTGTTYKCQIQGLESAPNDNIVNRVRVVKIISRDGSTVQSTQIALGNAASTAEWNTSMRNLSFLTGQTGANYTTVAGDRLCLEVGHDDSAGASVSGTLRFGADSAGSGDLGENETDTTNTLRPWFETSLDLIFEGERDAARAYRGDLAYMAARVAASGMTPSNRVE